MFPRRLNPCVAYKLEQVDPQLDATRNEGDKRLVPLRAVLRCASPKLTQPGLVDPDSDDSLGAMVASKRCKTYGAPILQSIMSSAAPNKPKVCLVCSNSKILSIQEADELDEESRAKCVPIQFTDTLAMPLDREAAEPHVILTFPKSMTGGARDAKIDVCRLGDDAISITTVSCAGMRKHMTVNDLPKAPLDKLFDQGVTMQMPKSTGIPLREKELPDYLKGALVDFLERRVRLQVMCTAAAPAPVSRPVAIERAYMRTHDEKRSNWLCVVAQLHPSSASCICPAHNMHFSWKGNVEVRVETCGRLLQDFFGNMRCPCHENAIDRTGNARFSMNGVCTEGTSISVTCYHRNGKVCKRGACLDSIRLTNADRLELSSILMNMAEFEARASASGLFEKGWVADRDRLAVCTDKMRESFEKSAEAFQCAQLQEQDPEVFNPRELLRRDMTAVDLIRSGLVFRHTYKRGERRGAPYIQRVKQSEDTPPLKTHENDIASTHSHLFRKAA